MLTGVAVDCGWLIELDGLTYDDLESAIDFWQKLTRKQIPILLDYDGRILSEYDQYLDGRTLGRKFLTKAFKAGNILSHATEPTTKCREALEAMSFDPSDIPYIGVAQRAGGAYLTHEQKHVEETRVERILKFCGSVVGDLTSIAGLLT